MAVSPAVRPIRLVVRDGDLRRSRLTVFFRLVLAIPHFVWLALWGIAAFVVAFVLWLAILIEGKAPESIHSFVAGYVRYSAHVGAYVLLAANAYPGFRGRPGYAVDLEIDPPARQSRWSGLFRLFLALPALLLASTLGGGFSWGSSGGSSSFWSGSGGWEATLTIFSATGAASAAAFLMWFAVLARGRAPGGLRDLVVYALGYSAQSGGYLLLLTGRYPSSDPALLDPLPHLPRHPVRVVVDDELERSRLTVFFRLLLAVPHLVWILLWSVLALLAALAAWLAALVTGRVPPALHRFLAAYVRYAIHVSAFLYVVGRRFPGFTGRAGSYGIDVEIDGPEKQRRLKTLLRLVLALPALLVASALGGVLFVVALLGWWVSLVRGGMPEGLRNLGASCLRYTAQTYAYFLLLTDRYPYGSPVLSGAAEPWEAREPIPGATP